MKKRRRRGRRSGFNKKRLLIIAGIIVLVIILVISLLLIFYKNKKSNKTVQKETAVAEEQAEAGLEINADKSFIVTYEESFDKSYYDKKELESMIDSEINEFNTNYAVDANQGISKESFKVSGKKAVLKLKFTNYIDYETYMKEYVNPENESKFFVGTYADAVAAGYTFEGEFKDADGSNYDMAGLANDTDTIIVYTNEDYTITSKGTIIAVNENVTDGKKYKETTAEKDNYLVLSFS